MRFRLAPTSAALGGLTSLHAHLTAIVMFPSPATCRAHAKPNCQRHRDIRFLANLHARNSQTSRVTLARGPASILRVCVREEASTVLGERVRFWKTCVNRLHLECVVLHLLDSLCACCPKVAPTTTLCYSTTCTRQAYLVYLAYTVEYIGACS